MRVKAFLFVCIATLTLTGCATRYDLQAITTDQQIMNYERGQAKVTSEQPSSLVVLKYVNNEDNHLVFEMAVKNKYSQKVNFGTENIQLADLSGKAIHISSASELIKSEQSAATGKKVFAALGVLAGVAASIDASRSTTTGTYLDDDSDIRKRRSGTYSETTSNPVIGVAGTAASIAGGAYAVTEINKTRDNNINAISKEYLQITTLNPGDTTSGIFKANLPPAGKYPQEITFVVNVGSDRHTFKYIVAKSK